MAIWRSSLGQSAVKNAGIVVSAELAAGLIDGTEEADERFIAVRDREYAYLEELAKADDAAYEAVADAPKSERPSGRTGSSKPAGRGGSKTKKFSLEEAEELEMNSGAFKGAKLGDVVTLDKDTAYQSYGYTNGSGEDFIAWLSSTENRNGFTRAAAEVIRADRGIQAFS